ncbi:unnamed protein product [Rotaria socialis]|uniref:Uncharacterized protein n=1 Tax=Rotaria socialis TaxID=392032 RepID=A0A820X8C4_9BILA|nr:unnamed protein product [Rotaria socialis]CAF3379243.1 unnamed protein product [Rotaria socialis]CAF3432404.1 unnamed protein product [Rotaria socialis]CAF3437892.1 unnamed protein product [Rotaria socialis]CAF3723990.1 unnamed protein product [Rotaria socialis]
MASSTVAKTHCAPCGKLTGIFTCRGCAKDFCTRHVSEHRQMLGKQMDEVILEHDQLRQKLDEFMADPRVHPLMIKVDEWERESIDKIRQAASAARQQLSNRIRDTNKEIGDLKLLSQELTKARDEDDFVETDLTTWIEKLEKLYKDFNAPDTIQILQDDNEKPFISKITISARESIEIFELSAGCTRIEDNGQVMVHNRSANHGSVCGKGQYSSGQHKFRFEFEQFSPQNWAFFGIIPKSSIIKDSSWNTPTVYGWTTNWNVTRNGTQEGVTVATRSDINKNDIFELLMDCDRRTIRLTCVKMPTTATHQLDVDIALCPFPWKIFLGLQSSVGDRIRIL